MSAGRVPTGAGGERRAGIMAGEGEREDFPEAMIFAWNQNNEQSVPVRGVVQVEKTATGKA